MKFEKKHFFGFLAAFTVGCVLVYASPVHHKTVFVYPTPLNFRQLNYKNASGECFRFSQKEVTCTSNAKSIPDQV